MFKSVNDGKQVMHSVLKRPNDYKKQYLLIELRFLGIK
jgi:hypothetical protein